MVVIHIICQKQDHLNVHNVEIGIVIKWALTLTNACSGGVFRECYNMLGGMDKAIPVDVYVPGCAARPESIIDGVVKGLGVLEEKAKAMKEKK